MEDAEELVVENWKRVAADRDEWRQNLKEAARLWLGRLSSSRLFLTPNDEGKKEEKKTMYREKA